MRCANHDNHSLQSGLLGFIGLVPPPLRIRAYIIQFITSSLTFVLYHVNMKYFCNVAEIIRVIQGLLYEKASGLGVPAYWQPGMQGILKDFKFVGKI